MDNAAKKIVGALKAAKVSAKTIERTRRFIDEAHDFDAAGAKQVEEATLYVCGVTNSAPKLTKDVLKNKLGDLVGGLSKNRTPDAWDLRALDVLVRASKMYWFWEVESWVDDRVRVQPKEPIFDETLELFRARGLWTSDDAVLDALIGYCDSHVTDGGTLTSAGRWLLPQIDRDFDRVLERARNYKDDGKKTDRTSRLYPILLAHRRELFDKLVPKLKLTEEGQRSYLAEVMLAADAKRYEKQALALMQNLKRGMPNVLSAKNLEKFFPGKYPNEVKRLLVAAIKAESEHFIFEDEATDSRTIAYEMAYPVLGDAAFDVWKAYEEKNDALRLDFYATIAKQAKQQALPWLIDGLVYPKDPNAEYGFVTHAKYVQRMLEILKPYDLAPYRDRIAKKFAKTKNKKIGELIGKVLGKKTAKPAKKRTPFDAKDGFKMDVYVASVAKAALAALKKQKLPEPIESLKLGGMSGCVRLEFVIVEGQGDTIELELDGPATRIPYHIDDDDKVMPKFWKLHELDAGDDDVPSWGDMYKLPWSVLIHEQIGAAHAIVDGLRARGAKVAKKCRVGVGEHDNFWESAASFERMSRSEAAALPEAQQQDFARACFEDRKKQKWLLKR